MEWIKEPFFQVGLPVMLTFVVSTWYQGKRIDDLRADLNKRLDEILRRLERIEAKIENHADRLAKLEERTSAIRAK